MNCWILQQQEDYSIWENLESELHLFHSKMNEFLVSQE